MTDFNMSDFTERRFDESDRPDDIRKPFDHDMGRIIHCAAFRRLQGKTQVMGPGEGDFHRTRLTHSIEAGQIGQGLVNILRHKNEKNKEMSQWLPSSSLIISACFAHDLGHPPYGHTGEKALQQRMLGNGGFEGNAQTLRILTKLEKYRKHQGINPTRRTILSVLKYPACYADYDENKYTKKPPKCFYQEENDVVDWALEPFSDEDKKTFQARGSNDRPQHMTLDASIMECADDIAYGVHDLEDIVARRFVEKKQIVEATEDFFKKIGADKIGTNNEKVGAEFVDAFFKDSYERKRAAGRLVNLFVSNVSIEENNKFQHPLMRYRLMLPGELAKFQIFLKTMLTYKLVVEKAEFQMLERRGQRLVKALYKELKKEPKKLIPLRAWKDLESNNTEERRVCDYVAGMTDAFAERVYHRLFTPGYGSSRDEL